MKFNFPAAPQLSRQQTMLAGGGAVVVIAAAVAAFLLLQPKGEPEASADTGVSAAARAKAARDSAIARRARMNAGAVAQSGSATTSTAAKPGAKGAALKTAAAPATAPATAPAPAAPAAKEAPKPAATPAVAAAPEVKKDTGVVIQREEFAYEGEGRRDPFFSLMTSQDLRPAVADLRLAGILWHPTRPIAVLREMTGNQQYRVTVGSTLGRMRVTQIRPKAVIFTIEEFGFSRRDSLILGDTTQVRAR